MEGEEKHKGKRRVRRKRGRREGQKRK